MAAQLCSTGLRKIGSPDSGKTPTGSATDCLGTQIKKKQSKADTDAWHVV
jgi:hypothetical protein